MSDENKNNPFTLFEHTDRGPAKLVSTPDGVQQAIGFEAVRFRVTDRVLHVGTEHLYLTAGVRAYLRAALDEIDGADADG